MRQLTPGSVTEPCQKEEKQTKNMYESTMGIAGEICFHMNGALQIVRGCRGQEGATHTRNHRTALQVKLSLFR